MKRKSLLRSVLTICFVVGNAGLALSQEQSAASKVEDVKTDSMVISIPTDDEFYFGKVRVALAVIPEKVKQALGNKPPEEQIVYVKASVFVKYGTVVSVINAVRTVGIEQIGLVSEKKKHTDGLRGPDVVQRMPVSKGSRSSGVTLSLDPPVIDVRSRTRFRLNSKPILLSRLERQLQELLDGRERKTVFIKAPSKMAYGDVIKVIDIAKGVGAQPIGLQIDRLAAKPK